jgi:hypothetical protein
VQIHLYIPGEDIFINHEREMDESHTDVYVAIRDAFASATRRLEDHIHRMRGA